jgi:hypothetical protein
MEKKFFELDERVREMAIGTTKGTQFAGLMEMDALNKRLNLLES